MRHATSTALWSRLLVFVAAPSVAMLGCAQPAQPVQYTAPQAAEPGPPSSGAEQLKAAADSLSGLWVEYWAVEGHTDTQRYALFDDGRFGWHAAGNETTGVVRRWGQWSQQGETLVLRVQGEEQAGGCRGDDCQLSHEPPREERLELGDCPPNDEAKALDASYRCVSIAGQAFWRRAPADDPSAYLPRQ